MTSASLTVEREGVPFVADDELAQLLIAKHGANFSLYALEAIASQLQEAIESPVHRVELYGVPPEQLYVKMHSGQGSWQEEWRLRFEHAGVQLTRV